MENNINPMPGMPEQHSSKAGMVVLAVMLLIIGLVAGYFIGKGGIAPVAYQTVTPTQSPSASINTTGWKTYRSEKYGFELKYPADLDYRMSDTQDTLSLTIDTKANLEMIARKSESLGTDGSYVFLMIDAGPIGKPLGFVCDADVERTIVTIDDIQARKCEAPMMNSWGLGLEFAKGKTQYLIRTDTYEGDVKADIDIILSTFRFTR